MLDPVLLVLAQQCMGGNVDPALTGRLLAEQPDPSLRLLGDLMLRRVVVNEAAPSAPVQSASRSEIVVEAPLARSIANQNPNRLLLAELRWLRQRNTELAKALGACSCWGEDPDCEDCRGVGQAGSREPEGPGFDQYVRPALRRVRKTLGRLPQRAPTPAASAPLIPQPPAEPASVERSTT